MKFLIYGANGYSGKLILKEAVNRGMNPLIAGRKTEEIKKLADEYNLKFNVFTLDDHQKLVEIFQGVDAVLNCAGPYTSTTKPMIEACLDTKTHYLDLTGDVMVHQLALDYHDRAKEKGIVVIPGVAFNSVPTDCLSLILKKQLSDANHLSLAIYEFDPNQDEASPILSRGTLKSIVEGLQHGGFVRENHQLKKVPFAYKVREIDFGIEEPIKKTCITISTADSVNAYLNTNIPNIATYYVTNPSSIKWWKFMNLFRWIFKPKFIQNMLKTSLNKSPEGPDETMLKEYRTIIWGEVKNTKGETVVKRIETPNPYQLTIDAALTILKNILNKNYDGGYYTPASLCSENLLFELQNVKYEEP